MATSNTPPPGGSGGGRGDLTPEERDAFKHRADELGRKLEAAKGHPPTASKTSSEQSDGAKNGAAMGKALRVSTELIGGIVVGSGLGWLLDQWLKTFPAFFIIGFLLGSAAGMMNVIRAAASIKTGPSNPKAGPSVQDDDET
jgi:ATP synthase protein I